MFDIWLLIIFRVLISIVPFACHFLNIYQDKQAAPLSHVEQHVPANLQQNPDLTRLSAHLLWPGQQPTLQAMPAVNKLLASSNSTTHDTAAWLADPPAPPQLARITLTVRTVSALPLPHVWCGSLAYSAQAPPSQA